MGARKILWFSHFHQFSNIFQFYTRFLLQIRWDWSFWRLVSWQAGSNITAAVQQAVLKAFGGTRERLWLSWYDLFYLLKIHLQYIIKMAGSCIASRSNQLIVFLICSTSPFQWCWDGFLFFLTLARSQARLRAQWTRWQMPWLVS